MPKPPSEFLEFLKVTAKPGPDGDLLLHASFSAKAIDRLIAEAKEHEDFYASADSELAPSAEPGFTESEDGGATPPNDSPLVSIRGEAKRAIAKLTDHRVALQNIVAIIDKHLGEQ